MHKKWRWNILFSMTKLCSFASLVILAALLWPRSFALQPPSSNRRTATTASSVYDASGSNPHPYCYLTQYAAHWENILITEYQHTSRELQEQRRSWPRRRLEANGISVFGAFAEPDTELFGEKVIRVVKPRSPIAFQDKFSRGDVLIVTPNVPNVDPLPRECLVMEVGKDWMSMGIGSNWLPGLWESRKHVGFYQVRLDRAAPQAPLKAQKRALRYLQKGEAGFASETFARLFSNSSIADERTYKAKFWNEDIESRMRAALEEAKEKTPFVPNQTQEDAIVWALQRGISLIRGPAGTGKTRLAAILISTALKYFDSLNDALPPRVLAVAHSNGAADVLLEALLQMGVPAVRLGRPATVAPQVQHRTVVAMAEKLPRMVELRNIMGDLTLDTQRRSSASYELRQEMIAMQDIIIQSAPVVVSSCIGAHHLFSNEDDDEKKSTHNQFSLVVCDEAAQTTEPALMCALAAARAKQLVMIGDTRQLPPTITFMDLIGTLGVSPMARLERAGVGLYTLQTQYRLPPALLEHPSKYFYDGVVGCAAEVMEKAKSMKPPRGFSWPNLTVPLAFVDSGRDAEVAHNFGGRSNPTEANLIVDIVDKFFDAGEIEASNIAIISPYSKQVQLIQAELLSRIRNGRGSDIRVGTIDSFQGQEVDLVLISAVRSNPMREMGFLRDPRRLCVAITRARRGLIILGDRTVLTSCRHWAALIDSCDRRQCSMMAADIEKPNSSWILPTDDETRNFQLSDLFDDEDDEFYGLFSTTPSSSSLNATENSR